MTELVRLFIHGLVRPVVSRVYPLDETPNALEDMGARKVVGKVVIDTRAIGKEGGGERGSGAAGFPSSRL